MGKRTGAPAMTKPIADKPLRCPLVAKITPLGCLLNKLKHETCSMCEGVDGHLDHVRAMKVRLEAMLPDAPSPSRSVPAPVYPGLFIPMDTAKVKELEKRGITAEHVEGMLNLWLSGDLCQRRPVIDPCAKSRIRPEG